jgi:hypothetical protein
MGCYTNRTCFQKQDLIILGIQKAMSKNKLITTNTLITETPEEGRALAIKMARLVIKTTQPDEDIRNSLRDVYAKDAMMLIQIGQTVAIEFSTIAAANNYWK